MTVLLMLNLQEDDSLQHMLKKKNKRYLQNLFLKVCPNLYMQISTITLRNSAKGLRLAVKMRKWIGLGLGLGLMFLFQSDRLQE